MADTAASMAKAEEAAVLPGRKREKAKQQEASHLAVQQHGGTSRDNSSDAGTA